APRRPGRGRRRHPRRGPPPRARAAQRPRDGRAAARGRGVRAGAGGGGRARSEDPVGAPPMPKYLPRATLAFRHALVATCDRGPSDAGLLADAAVAISDRLVGWVGPDAALETSVDLAGAEVVDVAGRLVTPGLVDSHTHLVFA